MTSPKAPSALHIATYAVVQLENNPLFNSGHGAVFTRDGLNELEASVMVSRGHSKRAVGVMGLRRVRNPILLARAILEHGDDDLASRGQASAASDLNIPSAQGHSQIHGAAAEQLARQYGLELVDPGYFFTQTRWDEHVRALEREKKGIASATWSSDEYLPQGTCGAVAADADGVVCAATSTGGMTNKLTGRIGDTPSVGAGFWAEEWTEACEEGVSIVGALKGLLADCLPMPYMYQLGKGSVTRSMGVSGTGNGDSFLRVNAVRTVAAMARWKRESTAKALSAVVGPGGELQRSAGDRWGRTGEGEGGMIGIESVVERDVSGRVVSARAEVVMDYNSGGMYRAWIDDQGKAAMSIWSNGSEDCNV